MRIFSSILISNCLLLCHSKGIAQNTIKGSITDKTGKGLPYASAVLQRLPDSSIILTTIADSTGNYSLKTGKLNNSILTASATGYAAFSKRISDFTTQHQQVDFALETESMELNEVAISSKKPLIERKVDRVVFNVENSITAIGGDALEAIGKAPGVQVNGTDDISLSGKSTVSIMINDKIIQLGGEELAEMLRTIPSENIARIEVITTPPARYDAAGNSGMINIVTKKSNKKGLNGSIGATLLKNSYTTMLGSGALNYRNDKLNIYGNTNFGDNYSKPVERYNGFYPNQQWQQVNNIDNLHNFHYSQAGIDYNITSKAIIGMLYTYAGSTPKMNEDINGRWLNNTNGIDSIIHTRAHTNDFGERNVVNVNYEWKIDTAGTKLNMDGDFFTRTGRTVRDFTTVDMLGDGTLTGINSTDRSTGKQVLYIGSAKADMELPTKFAKLSFGTKASFIHVISDNVFQYLDSMNYITDAGKSNKFDYQENTQALYLSGQKRINAKWDAQAGLRGEYTQTRAESVTLSTVHETKYFQLFPTGYLQYTSNEDNVFNLNYSRRIDRPNMSMINPFRRYMTPTSYNEGNPFLQPSFTSNLELSYTLKSKFTFSTYVQRTLQSSTQILQVDSVNKGYFFTYANIGSALNYGITATADLEPTKWWETNIQFYGFHARVNANYYNAAVTTQYDQTGFVIDNDNSFTLNKDKTLLAEFGAMYNSNLIENYNYHFPNFSLNAGVKALFFKRNLTITLNVSDIFRTEIIQVRNLYNQSVTNNYYDERGLHMYANWKFGNKNLKSKREHNATLEESKRT